MATADLFPVERIEKAILAALWPVSDRATPPRCGRSLTEPPCRPKVSNIAGDLRSAVSAGSETLAEPVLSVVSCWLPGNELRIYGGVDYTLMVAFALEVTICDLQRDVVGGRQIGGRKLRPPRPHIRWKLG